MKKGNLRKTKEVAVILIGVFMIVFVYVSSFFVIPPFYSLQSLEGDESIYSILEPNEEKTVFTQPRPSDFNYSLSFTIESDNPIEVSVLFDGDETFSQNATFRADYSYNWTIEKELSGALQRMGYLSVEVRNLGQELALVNSSVSLTTYYKESAFIGFVVFILGVLLTVGASSYTVWRIFSERKMQHLEAKRLKERVCGTCLWFGKPKCKRNEKLSDAKPCEDYT